MNIKYLALSGLLLALVCMLPAHANHYDKCSGATITLGKAVTGTFTASTPHLGALTGWFTVNQQNVWTCTTYRDEMTSALKVGLRTDISAAIHQTSFDYNGETYTVYKADSQNRVGYILRQNVCIEQNDATSCHNWRAINNSNANGAKLHFFNLINAHGDENKYKVHLETETLLLKWDADGNFPSTDFSLSAFNVASFKWWSEVIGDQFGGNPAPDIMSARPVFKLRISSTIMKRNETTCTTPSEQIVQLPTISRIEFTGSGTTAGNTPFTLKLSNCSNAIKKIRYTLYPVGGNNQNGQLNLRTGSTATGVKVQVRRMNGNPVSFNSSTPVPGYSAGAPETSITLQARYIQTSNNPVGAGKVHATMSVAYTYQ